jgi:hypothetical protein
LAWLYRQKHLVHYGQVMLIALNADGSNIPGSYPEFATGNEQLIHTDYCIVVTTKTDIEVEIAVTGNEASVPDGLRALQSIELQVPYGILELGNEMTSSKGRLSVLAGRYQISSFVDAAESNDVTRVCFLLKNIS